MRALLLWALLVAFAAPVAAQAGKVADDYVFIQTFPEARYDSDQEVVVPFTAQATRGNIDTQEAVSVRVVGALDGLAPNLVGAEALAQGVRAADLNHINFGIMEPGLYQFLVIGSADGLVNEYALTFKVVIPPVPYHAVLVADGKDGVFILDAFRDEDLFTVEVYRDGPGGRVVLERVQDTNHTEVRIPYVPGSPVYVEVKDANGWANYENAFHDLGTGRVVYGPWVWNPDYKQIHNYRLDSPLHIGLVLLVAMVGVGVTIYGLMGRRP